MSSICERRDDGTREVSASGVAGFGSVAVGGAQSGISAAGPCEGSASQPAAEWRRRGLALLRTGIRSWRRVDGGRIVHWAERSSGVQDLQRCENGAVPIRLRARDRRSEEHTSELQSLMRISYA